MLEHYIEVIEDLSVHLSPNKRYRRLLSAIQKTIPADALALLQLRNNVLQPLAVLGLRTETMGRRFAVDQHPRLAQILANRGMLRFASDSPLPDPYDGLIPTEDSNLHVHDCMGMSIYVDDKPWGIITLDALQAGSFDQVELKAQQAIAALTKAVVVAAQRIAQLEQKISRSLDVTAEINREQAARPLIGSGPVTRQLLQDMSVVARTQLTVLLQGETGVGKEIVARHLHLQSDRLDQPLVQINCAALPENLAEAELFGHTKGAFSGAHQARSGRFELADGGTLFLDEIGELSLPIQAKLLRALQEGEIQRMGSDHLIKVDVRIIAATNRNLAEEVKQGRFRADLYHRISVYPLTIPPLRERGGDTLEIAEYFLERDQVRLSISKLVLTATAKTALMNYSWPGNIRELEHVLSRAALKACQHQNRSGIVQIEEGHLDILSEPTSPVPPRQNTPPVASTIKLTPAVEDFKKHVITQRLADHDGNIAATARSLGLDRSNLLRLMRRLQIRATT